MLPKTIKQSLKYNPLLLPTAHKCVIQLSNIALWNEVSIINSHYPNEQITADHIVRESGNYYSIDLELKCENKTVQKMLDAAYERNMELPRFEKHEHFVAMISDH